MSKEDAAAIFLLLAILSLPILYIINSVVNSIIDEIKFSRELARQKGARMSQSNLNPPPLIPGKLWRSPEPIPHGDYISIIIKGVLDSSSNVYTAPYTRNCTDALYWWKAGETAPGQYGRIHNLFIDDSSESAVPISESRSEHRYCFAYRGRGKPLFLFYHLIPCPWRTAFYSNLQGSLHVSIDEPLSEDLVSAVQAGTVPLYGLEITPEDRHAKRQKVENEKIFAEILATYGEQHLLSDSTYLDNYARRHHAELLAAADEIVNDNATFQSNQWLVDTLKRDHPQIYERRLWRLRALERAQAAEAEEPDDAHERRQRKFAAFRERIVERERVQIEDDQAKAMVAFEAVEAILDAREHKIAQINERDDLSPEAKDERIRGIRSMADQQMDKLLKGAPDDKPNTPPTNGTDAPITLG